LRKTLYDVLTEKYPYSVNDRDFDSIESDVSYYLLQGFTIDDCVNAAINFLDEHPRYDDDPAACFSQGMHEHLSH
jgi:hypothetical protein